MRARTWRAANLERALRNARAYKKNNAAKVRAINARRAAAKLRATPIWASGPAIQAVYDEAARVTRETGIQHEVDHYYPLLSPVVCGLHVEHNLRVLTKSENSRKKNHHPDRRTS